MNMTVSLNSVVGFSSLAKNHHSSKCGIRASAAKVTRLTYPMGMVGVRRPTNGEKWEFSRMVADGDRIATESNDAVSVNVETKTESRSENPEDSNGSFVSADVKGDTSSANTTSIPKRVPLTAREKLRAARVLSRRSESRAVKSKVGSTILDVLRESDKGKKRPSLPEAPTNMLDDSKRGVGKGFTFEFPGGADVLLILVSFVLISTIMFGTTYVVWKVGAIHFNEY